MEYQEVDIEIFDKRENSYGVITVQLIGQNKYRMIDNDIWNCSLTLGTEFETRINKDGRHEIIGITKESEFITKRFFLSPKYKESEYRMIGDELMKHGGFWQVDFGGIVTINIPKDLPYDVDQVLKELDITIMEI